MLNVKFIWPYFQPGKRFLVINGNQTTGQEKDNKIRPKWSVLSEIINSSQGGSGQIGFVSWDQTFASFRWW